MDNGHPLAAVLGLPAAHSLSPVIHGHWLAACDLSASYIPIEVQNADFDSFFQMAPRLGFRGFNVTAPYKQRAFELCVTTTDRARRAQSVNLVVFSADGAHGDSTDGRGFLASLAAAVDFEPADKRIAVLGAGGAARAIVDALLTAGAATIVLANRTQARAEALAARFDDRVSAWSRWPAAQSFFDGADLIIHGTTYGMKGVCDGEKPWRLPPLKPDVVAAELIYAPLETPFLRDAAEAGARTVDGLGMLLHQAAPCFTAWFGVDVAVDAGLRGAVMRALDRQASEQGRGV